MKLKYELNRHDSDNGIEVGKIAPCPFCGKTDKLCITGRNFFEELVQENGSAVINIYCKRCDASLSEYGHDYTSNDYSFRAGVLVAKWNTREVIKDGD